MDYSGPMFKLRERFEGLEKRVAALESKEDKEYQSAKEFCRHVFWNNDCVKCEGHLSDKPKDKAQPTRTMTVSPGKWCCTLCLKEDKDEVFYLCKECLHQGPTQPETDKDKLIKDIVAEAVWCRKHRPVNFASNLRMFLETRLK